jgi:hypothetical protein
MFPDSWGAKAFGPRFRKLTTTEHRAIGDSLVLISNVNHDFTIHISATYLI